MKVVLVRAPLIALVRVKYYWNCMLATVEHSGEREGNKQLNNIKNRMRIKATPSVLIMHPHSAYML